jgi:chorismate-pyruvate lyase
MTAIRFDDFASLFPLGDDVVAAEPVVGRLLPPPYGELLDHTSHMTVTVERHFGERVTVRVLDWDRDGDLYARKILLHAAESGRCVQYGIVRIRLDALPATVTEQILSERQPLGRVLIDNGVLTTVQPVQFLKVSLGPNLTSAFDCPYPSTSYGRIGRIEANGRPAIDVLEILRPL